MDTFKYINSQHIEGIKKKELFYLLKHFVFPPTYFNNHLRTIIL